MAFNKPVDSALLGLKPSRNVFLCSRVVPMGWVSSTGLIQHVHRNLLLHTLPPELSLNPRTELRRDKPMPSSGVKQ
eukprot:1429680-Karenia_brevis.AAC.1